MILFMCSISLYVFISLDPPLERGCVCGCVCVGGGYGELVGQFIGANTLLI